MFKTYEQNQTVGEDALEEIKVSYGVLPEQLKQLLIFQNGLSVLPNYLMIGDTEYSVHGIKSAQEIIEAVKCVSDIDKDIPFAYDQSGNSWSLRWNGEIWEVIWRDHEAWYSEEAWVLTGMNLEEFAASLVYDNIEVGPKESIVLSVQKSFDKKAPTLGAAGYRAFALAVIDAIEDNVLYLSDAGVWKILKECEKNAWSGYIDKDSKTTRRLFNEAKKMQKKSLSSEVIIQLLKEAFDVYTSKSDYRELFSYSETK